MALKIWMLIGGESLFWLRLFPVVFSVLALVPFLLLCRELKLTTSTIAFAVFLFAVNGSMIRSAQFVRMYSLLLCLSLFSIWLFVRYFNRGGGLVPLVLVNLLLVYTHYYGWLVVGSEVVAILLFQRDKWRPFVIMSGILIAAYIPWLVSVAQAAGLGSDIVQNIAWQAKPGVRELFAFVIELAEPFYFPVSNIEPASVYLVSVPLVVVILVVLAIYVTEWKREENKLSVLLLLVFVVFPLAMAFLASWVLPQSVWGTRHMIFIFPLVMILVANAALSLPLRAFRFAAVILIVLLSAAGFAVEARRESSRHVWCAWNDVADGIKGSERSGEHPTKIYTFENLIAYHMWFALRDTDRFRVAAVKGVDVRTADETYFLPRGFDGVDRASIDDISDQKIWVVFRTSGQGHSAPILAEFERKGYKICSSNLAEYPPTTVLWLQMGRGSCE
jgi:uncharacterized membrane protein